MSLVKLTHFARDPSIHDSMKTQKKEYISLIFFDIHTIKHIDFLAVSTCKTTKTDKKKH